MQSCKYIFSHLISVSFRVTTLIFIKVVLLVIYSKGKEGKAFVHANSSERKWPYSGVPYLVLFDTFLESEFVTLY
jgi:hypothetical protein